MAALKLNLDSPARAEDIADQRIHYERRLRWWETGGAVLGMFAVIQAAAFTAPVTLIALTLIWVGVCLCCRYHKTQLKRWQAVPPAELITLSALLDATASSRGYAAAVKKQGRQFVVAEHEMFYRENGNKTYEQCAKRLYGSNEKIAAPVEPPVCEEGQG